MSLPSISASEKMNKHLNFHSIYSQFVFKQFFRIQFVANELRNIVSNTLNFLTNKGKTDSPHACVNANTSDIFVSRNNIRNFVTDNFFRFRNIDS